MRNAVLVLALAAAACQSPTERATPPAPAQTPPARTAVQFLHWYRHQLRAADSIPLLDNATGQRPGQFYRVNFAQTEAYLALLQHGGYVSAAYLTKWRRYFRQQDEALRRHPQNEGPPPGFDFDLVTNSQEPSLYLAGASKAQLVTAYPAPQRALVTATFRVDSTQTNRRLFYLRQYPAGWLIDSIAAN